MRFVRVKWQARDVPSVYGALVCLWRLHGRFSNGCIYDCGNTRLEQISGQESVSSCGVMLRFAGMNMNSWACDVVRSDLGFCSVRRCFILRMSTSGGGLLWIPATCGNYYI